MSQETLPVAVIGVGGIGAMTLAALQGSELVRVVGISDHDREVADRVGHSAGVPAYTDNRSLLAETRPRAVFLAVPPMAAPDLLSACAERGVHVWKEQPLARTLGEGVAMVQLMAKAGVKLVVGTQRRFAAGYRRAWELRDRLGEVFLCRAHYLFNWGPKLGWRGDKSSAGGGALLELGYHPIDLLLWMRGLPEQVYGLSASGNRPETQGPDGEPLPVYDTDDTAVAVLRYKDGCMATVVTTRCSGPMSEALSLHGRGGSLTASSESCTLRDPDGNIVDRTVDESAPVEVFRRQAEAFARAVLGDASSWGCSGRENLLNLATIEAIDLSGRTNQPEHPPGLLKTHGLTAEQCLIHCPPEVSETPARPEEICGETD